MIGRMPEERLFTTFTRRGGNTGSSGLPNVSDPDQVYSDILRDDYDQYEQIIQPRMRDLIGQVESTELIDRVPETVEREARKAEGIRQRNLQRYGGAGLSQAQLREQERAAQRGEALSLSGGLNVARRNQRALNQGLLRDLVALGKGINQDALSGLGTAARGQSARQNAYKNASTQYRNNLVSLGSTFAFAALGF
jgi:hypothetical protein